METQTRFALNAAIEDWRQELAAQIDLSPEVRRELETHLRDTIAELQRHGLNDEESFWLARRRIGQLTSIGREFGHVRPNPAKVWRARVFWMVVGVFVINLLRFVSITAHLVLMSLLWCLVGVVIWWFLPESLRTRLKHV
ncbi:MAG TPA: permease prefix domain 1-containing protein [Verrucomicrobiae bacterium]|nr:permease prefix domain 1-containing protein [Verrucomicrobiae bacterium]